MIHLDMRDVRTSCGSCVAIVTCYVASDSTLLKCGSLSPDNYENPIRTGCRTALKSIVLCNIASNDAVSTGWDRSGSLESVYVTALEETD
jgi:hypothetical protein